MLTDMTATSKEAKKSSLFIAIKGFAADGAEFIHEAYNNGCRIIAVREEIYEKVAQKFEDALVIPLKRERPFLSLAAATFFKPFPGSLSAVTGTNGKTSVVGFVYQIWKKLGIPGARIGTLGLESHNYKIHERNLTTPDPIFFAKTLHELHKNGVTHVITEASSHGLEQRRLYGFPFQTAALTFFGQDHLDYHLTIENYRAAKKLLFTEVLEDNGTVIINPSYKENLPFMEDLEGKRRVTYGDKGSDVTLKKRSVNVSGQFCTLEIFGKAYNIRFPLFGKFQLENALCALSIVIQTCPEKLDDAVMALETLQSIEGRLEYIGKSKKGGKVFIDYAHTPDAFEVLLSALKETSPGKLKIVFGCGGDRDSLKRRLMGKVAQQYADLTVITDDNPRSEDPSVIRNMILEGNPNAEIIPDRREAIHKTVAELEKGDILVIAGKGRDFGQIVKGTIYPFDDTLEIKAALSGSIS